MQQTSISRIMILGCPIVSGGKENRSHQSQKVQNIGLEATQRKGNNQPGRRPATAPTASRASKKPQTSSQGHQIAKGEEGKKKNDKKKMEKNGKAAHSDFYADMGKDSPIQR